MRRRTGLFSMGLVLLISLIAMPALGFNDAGQADRFQGEVSEESVSGNAYSVQIFFSTGGKQTDCYAFKEDGTFYSNRGLEGTWTESGARWSAEAMSGGGEEIDLNGISPQYLLIGVGASSQDYSFFFFGQRSRCGTAPSFDALPGESYKDASKSQ